MEVLYLVIGLIAGGGIVYLVMRSWLAGRRQYMKEKVIGLEEETLALDRQIKERETEMIRLTRELAVATTNHTNLKEKLEEQKTEISNLHDRFRIEFKNLANEIFEEKSKKFTEQNRSNLDQLLKPLGEKIRDFEKKIGDAYDKEAQQRFSLKEEVKRLAELNKRIAEDAENLTRALKGDSKAQGNWGEMILENILERSGLVKDREYIVQPSFQGDDGRRMQPDIVVTYPGNRSVIIDAKVSLTAYERLVDAPGPELREKYLKEHLNSIRNHITELSNKNYLDIYQVQSLDFIMMFLPVEPAYLVAIKEDPEIWNYAYDRRILLISPTNLLAALKMIASLWRQEHQNKNALEIARQSGDLLDKFYALLSDLNDLGNRLKLTQKSYDDAINKLSEGKGNLIRRAQRIEELGAKTKKKLPDNYESRAGD
ncbi:MAG: DNA recombination protein RmuC [Bacteroidales bacterium]|jgi:DNA recombination protein RmuC